MPRVGSTNPRPFASSPRLWDEGVAHAPQMLFSQAFPRPELSQSPEVINPQATVIKFQQDSFYFFPPPNSPDGFTAPSCSTLSHQDFLASKKFGFHPLHPSSSLGYRKCCCSGVLKSFNPPHLLCPHRERRTGRQVGYLSCRRFCS